MTHQSMPDPATNGPATESDDTATEPESSDTSMPERIVTRVRVFHNNQAREAMLTGYEIGHTVTEVYTYDETDPAATADDLDVADRAFELFNIGDDPAYGTPDPRAVEYRDRKNRSLSVGDVLAIAGRFHACDFTGWREMGKQPTIRQQPERGTTPLY